MLTPFVARAATGSTDLLELTPFPLALSLTPVALELPEFVILTFQVAALPFFALVGPVGSATPDPESGTVRGEAAEL